MKQYLGLLLMGMVLTSVSCKKDSGSGGGGSSNVSGPFVAKVDGVSFPETSAEKTSAKYVTATKMLQIIGQPADAKQTIVLTLMNFDNAFTFWKPGVYDFNPTQITAGKYLASAEYNKWNGSGYDQWNEDYDYSQVGKITIESISDTHIKGSFYFTAFKKNSDGSYNHSDIKTVTDGAFDLDIKRY